MLWSARSGNQRKSTRPMNDIWIAAGGVIIILVVIFAAFVVGKKYGKSEQTRKDNQSRVEDMAHNADIASKPHTKRPLDELFK